MSIKERMKVLERRVEDCAVHMKYLRRRIKECEEEFEVILANKVNCVDEMIELEHLDKELTKEYGPEYD